MDRRQHVAPRAPPVGRPGGTRRRGAASAATVASAAGSVARDRRTRSWSFLEGHDGSVSDGSPGRDVAGRRPAACALGPIVTTVPTAMSSCPRSVDGSGRQGGTVGRPPARRAAVRRGPWRISWRCHTSSRSVAPIDIDLALMAADGRTTLVAERIDRRPSGDEYSQGQIAAPELIGGAPALTKVCWTPSATRSLPRTERTTVVTGPE